MTLDQKLSVDTKTLNHASKLQIKSESENTILGKLFEFALSELKANQRALRYGVEDRLGQLIPQHSYTYGPELAHGRIETRTYRVYDGLNLIADKAKWGWKPDNCGIPVRYTKEINRRALHRKAAVYDQPAN